MSRNHPDKRRVLIFTRRIPLTDANFEELGADPATITTTLSGNLSQRVLASATANDDSKTFKRVFSISDHLPDLHWIVAAKNADAVVEEVDALADVVVAVGARLVGGAAQAATLDLYANRSDGEGGVDTGIGAAGDLNETAIEDLNDDEPAWTEYEFTLDGADVIRGDDLWGTLVGVVSDNTTTNKHMEIGYVELRYYARG